IISDIAEALERPRRIPGSRRWLVGIERQRKVGSLRATISDVEEERWGKFPFHVEIPLLCVRSGKSRIDAGRGARVGAESSWKRVDIELDRAGCCGRESLRVAEWRIRSQRVKAVQRSGLVIKDAVAAANHGRRLVKRLPRETETRREIQIV